MRKKWLSLGAIFNYKTGHLLRALLFQGPPSEVTAMFCFCSLFKKLCLLRSNFLGFLVFLFCRWPRLLQRQCLDIFETPVTVNPPAENYKK